MRIDCNNPTIYSIGYGNRTIETFISLLNRYMIQRVIDVRTNPFSRFNPNFRRQKLEDNLVKANIQYEFMGDRLGGKPSEAIMYHEGKLQYENIIHSQQFINGINGLIMLCKEQNKIAIMCSELDPNKCHRKTIIGRYLETMKLDVIHI